MTPEKMEEIRQDLRKSIGHTWDDKEAKIIVTVGKDGGWSYAWEGEKDWKVKIGDAIAPDLGIEINAPRVKVGPFNLQLVKPSNGMFAVYERVKE